MTVRRLQYIKLQRKTWKNGDVQSLSIIFLKVICERGLSAVIILVMVYIMCQVAGGGAGAECYILLWVGIEDAGPAAATTMAVSPRKMLIPGRGDLDRTVGDKSRLIIQES